MSIDPEKTKKFLQNKEKIRNNNLLKLYNEAISNFNQIIDIIIKKYNPERIYQWGSLLNEKDFSEISDIDIAVEGNFSAETFFSMYGDAMKIARFPVDLVELDKIEPEFREQILKYGKKIYDRNEKS